MFVHQTENLSPGWRVCMMIIGIAPVAQGIEQRFPKAKVAGSNPAGGISTDDLSVS
jgi:hypothetical protein